MRNDALVRQIVQEHSSILAGLPSNIACRLVGAAVRNNTRAVELLLAQGWPSNAVLDNNQTALHYAAWHGNVAMVRALLQHNAPVNIFENEHGGSPLGWALHGSLNSWERERGDYPQVTLALLAAGAALPRPERPLEATEEVLEIIRQHVP
jgi:ankyrin repeat protein